MEPQKWLGSPKIPIKRGQKVIFLIFGHEDLSLSPRYYGCLYILIRVLGCPKHNPNVLYLDLKIKKIHFSTLAIFSKSLKNHPPKDDPDGE